MTVKEKEAFDALVSKVNAMGETLKEHDEQIGIKWAYNDGNIPKWAKETVSKLIKQGHLKGGDKNSYELSYLMLRLLVILDRAGLFNK